MKELYHKEGAYKYFGHSRPEMVRLTETYLKSSGKKLQSVLEIGCGGGGTGKLMKEQLGVEYYAGVELMDDAAEQAKENLDWAMCGNIEQMIEQGRLAELPDRKFDAIVFLDVLEHLYNPWRTLDALIPYLNPGGLLIASIPNAGNLYVINKLLRDRFEYDEEGLLDRTHIRFFTLHTIRKMLKPKWELVHLDHNKPPFSKYSMKQKLIHIATFGRMKRLFVVQFLFVAKLK